MNSTKDRTVLRDLARRVAEVAALPVMAERKMAWKQHNALRRPRPMILVFPEGAWQELVPDSALQCASSKARPMERDLRQRLYAHEHFDSDNVVEAEWDVYRAIRNSGWGLEEHWTHSPDARGARKFDPVIREPADLKKLRFPEVTVDEAVTRQSLAEAQDLFGDLLQVRLRGIAHLSFHLMNQYTALRGLEEVMLDMYENPGMLHDAMAFFEEGHRRLVDQYCQLNLFTLNNDSTYHSSGGVGYTDELPAPGFDPARVRPCDLWASAEAQEMALVSPEMHAEFILAYEKRLLAPFGLNGYGCCEDLTRKLDDVLTIPNIRRISISPWADVALCAAKLRGKAIVSWKPQPAMLVGAFNPGAVREYLRHALEATQGCAVEMILKDTHTCENHPERFDQWCRIARELALAYT
ncbi:MAG: hypothetical protein WC789_00665 [Lentisphaeria bacterium]|jgi:hypothetical protein